MKNILENEYIIDAWYRLLNKDKEHLCFCDENKYTRKDIEDISGRVYAYLINNDYKTEDVILINTSSKAMMLTLMLGVIKAGLVFVNVEKDYPIDRLNYIKKETKSKLVVDDELLKEIKKYEYIKGYKKASEHDGAYIVYTSGTTGKPKGIIHEYGDYYKTIESQFNEIPYNENSRFCIPAPLNFIASILIFISDIYVGSTLYLPNTETTRNPYSILEYLHSNKINGTFLIPPFIKLIGNSLNPEMECVYTGSQSTNNICINNGKLYNTYVMSEVGFHISRYIIKEPLQNCPIGKPSNNVDLRLSKDNEILINNPYCRGYINDEELNNKAFKDNYFYTGDLGYLDENGNYYLKGRLFDTIKLNGNRIEPQEIENEVSNLFNIESIIKLIEEPSPLLVLFYVSENEIQEKEFQNKLKTKLPYYMLPSKYQRIDSLPRNNMGKVDRKSKLLQITNDSENLSKEELQNKLLSICKDVLNKKDFSINDDFFDNGATSIDIVNIVSKLNVENFEAKYLYLGLNIKNTINQYFDNKETLSTKEKEQLGLEGKLHLTGLAEAFCYLSDVSNKNTENNISVALQISKLIDLERLKTVINNYMKNSSMFNVVFTLKDNRYFARYAKELYKDLVIETMSEEEVEELRKTFVKPFNPQKELSYRVRLISSKKYNYLFFDINHYLTDGQGLKEIFEDIISMYFSKSSKRTNNFFAYLYDEMQKEKNGQVIEAIKYYDERYKNNIYVNPFKREEDWTINNDVSRLFNTNIKLNVLDAFLKRNNITRLILFSTAEFISAVKYCKADRFKFRCILSNRAGNNNTAGCLIRASLVDFDMKRYKTIKDVYDDLKDQYRNNNKYSASGAPKYDKELDADELCVDDLSDILSIPSGLNKFIKKIELEKEIVDDNPYYYKMLRFYNEGGYLKVNFSANEYYLPLELQDKFISIYLDVIKSLVEEKFNLNELKS